MLTGVLRESSMGILACSLFLGMAVEQCANLSHLQSHKRGLDLTCVGLQSGFSKNKLAAQTLLFEQGGMKQ